MGKVFTSESVARETVPRSGDQERVANAFIEAVADIPHLDATIVFGSTALGNANRRSDTDVALAYGEKGNSSEFFIALRDIIQALPQGELIEPFIASRRNLADPTTSLHSDAFMAEHLKLVARESTLLSINPELFANMPDPLSELPSDQAATLAERVVTNYLENKIRKFFNASRQNDIENYHRLQRAFELPTAITRKLLRLQTVRSHYRTEVFQAQFYDRDNLAHESQQLSQLLGREWAQHSAWLIERDGEYSQLLEDTIEGTTSIETYQTWLDDVAQPSFDRALRLSVAALAIRDAATYE